MQLGVDASLELMSSLSLSWTGQRALRMLPRKLNAPIRIASEADIKGKLRTFDVRSEYNVLMLEAKKPAQVQDSCSRPVLGALRRATSTWLRATTGICDAALLERRRGSRQRTS